MAASHSLSRDAVGGDVAVIIKPRLRGWSHLVATAPMLVGAGVLVGLSAGHLGRQLALLGYGLVSAWLYFLSGVYHAVDWSPSRRRLLRRIDHANIFVMVAATYTPITLTILHGAWMITILSLAWGIALIGIIAVVPALAVPRGVLAGCYLLQGWTVVVAMPVIHDAIGNGGLALLLVAGALYTAGAIVYAVRRPDIVPGWFGYHEVFHACVLAANAVFFAFMVVEVVPHV